MSLDPRLELLEPVEDPLAQRYDARFAGKPANVWIAKESTHRLVSAQLAALAKADLPRVLRSPYLGRVLHGGTDEEGMPYLVVEAVDAMTLEQRMTEGPAFKATDAVRMIVDLLGGVAALEKLDLNHGAVEPRNIRVIDASRGSTLRLFRLGANTRGVRTGQIDADGIISASALAYAAPEQARGDLGSEVSADAFSTVAVLYAMLSGRLPFGGLTAEEVLSDAANGAPPSLGVVRPELAGALAETIDRALSSDVSERFGSITELQRALRGALLKSPALRSLETVVGERQGAIAPPAPDAPEPELNTGGDAARDAKKRPTDEFGIDSAFDETFGESDDEASGAPDDEDPEGDAEDPEGDDAEDPEGDDAEDPEGDDAEDPEGDEHSEESEPSEGLKLNPPVPYDEDDDEEEGESTRVGQVSPSLLAAMDDDDDDDDDDDEPTRVGAVSADLIAMTLPEIGEDNDSATMPGSEALLEVLNLRAELRDSNRPPKIESSEAVTEQAAGREAAPEPSKEPPNTLDTTAPRHSERPAGALPVSGDPSPLAPSEDRDDSGGWMWMLVAALVIAAAVAAGMMYGS